MPSQPRIGRHSRLTRRPHGSCGHCRSMPRIVLACCAFLLLSSVKEMASTPRDVQLEMRNVRLHVDDGIVLEVSRLRGIMVSRSADAPPVFDDSQSYVLKMQTATLAMDMTSLQNLMNRH